MKSRIKNTVLTITIILCATLSVGMLMSVNKKEEQSQILGVHIKGEVKNPGYYELEYGSRIKDAIEKAGGETPDANLNSINLAMKIIDGQEIVVESIPVADTQTGQYSEESQTKASESMDDYSAETKITAADSVNDTSEKININTADISLLCELEGIGESIAGAIIEYRNANGNFKSVEELKNVKGIGDAKFEKIKYCITV